MNPKTLEIQLTPKCNMQCVYCGNAPDRVHGENLTAADAVRAIEALKPETVLFTGGEVYYAWDTLIAILDMVKPLGLNYILSSNLSLIGTADLALLIDSYGFRTFHSSFNDLTVSMSHNIRKANAQARARMLENLGFLASRDVTVKIETMLIAPNIDHLLEINAFLAELGIRHHKLEYLIPVGHASDHLLLPPETIVDKVVEFYRNKQNDTVVELTCFCLSPCMDAAKKLFAINRPDFIFNRCVDGRESCYLLADGTLVPCFLFPAEESSINVRTHDLLHAWQHNPIFAGYRQAHPDCGSCGHFHHSSAEGRKVCNNGCATYNYIRSRSFAQAICSVS